MESEVDSGFSQQIIRAIADWVVTRVCEIKILGAGELPDGACLLLPNHLSWFGAVVLQVSCPRPIRFLVDAEIYEGRFLSPILRLFGALPVCATKSLGAIEVAVDALKRGEVVCLFPESEIARQGTLLRLKSGFEWIARKAESPVVPVWVDEVLGRGFLFWKGGHFFKGPKQKSHPVSVVYGEAISWQDTEIATVRERMLGLGELCYQSRPQMREHLGRAAIAGLRRGRGDIALIDGLDGGQITRGMLLAAAIALSSELRRLGVGDRVGIVLPPGKGAAVANLAVVLAGKVPVNLNFTAGRGAIEAASRIAGLEHTITARVFQDRLPDFPWSREVLYLEQMIPKLKSRIAGWRLWVELLPAGWIGDLLRLPKEGDKSEALVLFTSGSSGDPKGVVLSHRNLIGNVTQFSTMLGLGQEDAVLSCLPIFHSFGSTVTLWYPILVGVRMVTYPNPQDALKNAELIQLHRVSLLCSTPTFLRGYLRRVEPVQLGSLRLIVTGAERLPMEVADAFEERFGKIVLQGYGLTETSPVVSVNLPEPETADSGLRVHPSNRRGSVGKLAPGMAAQIRDPETGEVLSLHATGMIWFKGPNVFEHYLNDPERTHEVLQDGWFKSGDLGRFDEDGFLYIEGRISRFSKIGGEMVPHETIEIRLMEVLEISPEERSLAVAGVPDVSKGEALVVLATREIDATEVRLKLQAVGFPNLWIPRRFIVVPEIPHLATGKLDLKRVRELAEGH